MTGVSDCPLCRTVQELNGGGLLTRCPHAERTIGDILAEALTQADSADAPAEEWVQIPSCGAPVDATTLLFGPLAPRLAPRRSLAAFADSVSRQSLAVQIANHLEVDLNLVADTIRALPQNLSPLLHSPEGWCAIAEYVGAQVGRVRLMAPMVH